jgi:2-polyprenyl-3-methyl-5-hydroxy-6-metoxy-1,4-benzoquinol methylase
MVGVNNITTSNRKRQYHKSFLSKDFFKPEMKALDIGCGIGYLLDMLYIDYGLKRENLYGTEYSEAMRNFARNHYGINTGNNILPDEEYDFISYYHVLEHIQFPDRELLKIKDILKDDGLLYISVPVWFGSLEEASGTPCQDFENLFHVNHINTWTIQGIKNLLNKTGFEIIKQETKIYGFTVLCKKSEPKTVEKEDYKKIIGIMENQIKAISLLNQKKYIEAMEIYPNYPDAYIFYTMSREMLPDIQAQLEALNKGMGATDGNLKIKEHIGSVLYQWDESGSNPPAMSNNIRTAEKIFLEIDKIRPNENIFLKLGFIEGVYKKNYKKAIEYLKRIIEINPTRYAEITNFICNFQTK